MFYIRMLFIIPGWLLALLSLLAFFIAFQFFGDAERTIEERKSALLAGQPAAVNLVDFRLFRDFHPAGEVHVRGLMSPDEQILLHHDGKYVDFKHAMFVVYGTRGDRFGSRAAAVVIVDLDDLAAYRSILAASGSNPDTQTTIAGLARVSEPPFADVDDKLLELGIRRTDHFIYIEPFVTTREAALLDPDALDYDPAFMITAVGFAIVLLAVLKMQFDVWQLRRHGPRPASSAQRTTKRSATRDTHVDNPVQRRR